MHNRETFRLANLEFIEKYSIAADPLAKPMDNKDMALGFRKNVSYFCQRSN